MNCR